MYTHVNHTQISSIQLQTQAYTANIKWYFINGRINIDVLIGGFMTMHFRQKLIKLIGLV